MAGFRISDFTGAYPIRDIRLLPANAASEAEDVRLVSGALDGVREPAQLKSLLSTTKSVYRIPLGALDDLPNSYWMEFADADTDVIRTPTANDSFERYYWCSPSTGFRYATKSQILAGSSGLQPQTQIPAAPSVNFTPGTAADDTKNIVTRSYAFAFVTEFGEEGPLGATDEVTGPADADFVVGSIPQPVVQAGFPTITQLRLYRTVTAESGTTTFFRVIDLATGTTLYTDRLTDTFITGQLQLPTVTYAAPPPMDGMALMPGGIFVGFKGNNIYFSEPYKPHAWPPEYTVTVQFPIVGLGVFGNSTVVLTTGNPATISGTQPISMTVATMAAPLPCMSRRSIVSTSEGVYYASPNGLALIGPGGMRLVGEEVIGRDIWQRDYQPQTIRAVHVYGAYSALRTVGSAQVGFLLPTTNLTQQAGVTDLKGFTTGAYVGMDYWSGRPWLIQASKLYEWLPSGTNRKTYRWRSREYKMPRPTNMAVAEVYFEEADFLLEIGRQPIRLRVFADRRLVYDQPIAGRSGEAIRLPDGYRATYWQAEIEACVVVHDIELAHSVTELKSV